jgi:hypothetical protein
VCLNCVRQYSQYSNLLQAGQSEDRILVAARYFTHPSRLVLGLTKPPIQWVPSLSQEYSGRGVAVTFHPPPASAKVKEKNQSYISTLLILWAIMACSRVNFSFTLPFYLNSIMEFIYLLTPCRRVLLKKVTGCQLVKKFPTFYGTQGFITMFTSASHLSHRISPGPRHMYCFVTRPVFTVRSC